MSRRPDNLEAAIQEAMGEVRSAVDNYTDDMAIDWFPMLSKADFVARVRAVLDDLDESELGAIYDANIEED